MTWHVSPNHYDVSSQPFNWSDTRTCQARTTFPLMPTRVLAPSRRPPSTCLVSPQHGRAHSKRLPQSCSARARTRHIGSARVKTTCLVMTRTGHAATCLVPRDYPMSGHASPRQPSSTSRDKSRSLRIETAHAYSTDLLPPLTDRIDKPCPRRAENKYASKSALDISVPRQCDCSHLTQSCDKSSHHRSSPARPDRQPMAHLTRAFQVNTTCQGCPDLICPNPKRLFEPSSGACLYRSCRANATLLISSTTWS